MKKGIHLSLVTTALCGLLAVSAVADGLPRRPDVFSTTTINSRKLTRGLPDHNDPYLTETAGMRWLGFAASVTGHFNMTDVEEEKGFDRWENKEIDYAAGYGYLFGKDDLGLGTSLAVDAGYVFEFDQAGLGENGHIQYFNLSLGLPDLYLSPTIAASWMLDSYHGQVYVLGLSHGFTLVGGAGEGAAPVLTLRLSFNQTLADDKYNENDLGKDFWALRDSTFRASLDWNVCKGLTISPYAAYADTYAGSIRPAAHYYEDKDVSHGLAQFYGGVTVAASF